MSDDLVNDLMKRINALEDTLTAMSIELHDNAEQASVLLPIAQHFVARALERHDDEAIREAFQAIVEDTGIDVDRIIDLLHSMSVIDSAEEYFNRTFFVGVTVPVTVNVEVEARDYAHAEDLARDEVEMNGLDSYYQDVDWDRVDYYVKEA